MKLDKIGVTKFAIHNKVLSGEMSFGNIRVCKLKTYEKKDNKVQPILWCSQTKSNIDLSTHIVYNTLEKAVKALKTKK